MCVTTRETPSPSQSTSLLQRYLQLGGGVNTCTRLMGENHARFAPPGAMIFATPFSVKVTPYVPCFDVAPLASYGVLANVDLRTLHVRVGRWKTCETVSVPVTLEAMNSPPKE